MTLLLTPIFMFLAWLPVDFAFKYFFEDSWQNRIIYTGLLLPNFIGSLSLATYLTSPSFKGRLGEWKVSWIVKWLGLPILNDVILDNGESRLTQIDHLVLLGDHIAVVETKAFSGVLSSGQTWQDPWHRVKGDRYVQSPQAQNHRHLEYVRKHVGDDVPVIGYVVITGRATFLGGWPSGVYSLNTFFCELACCKKSRSEARVVEACPHCGEPDPSRRERNKKIFNFVLGFVILVVALGYGLFVYLPEVREHGLFPQMDSQRK